MDINEAINLLHNKEERFAMLRNGKKGIQVWNQAWNQSRKDIEDAFPNTQAGIDLSLSDLSGVDLTGANLVQAILIGTKLVGANLTGADLTNSDLTGANLTRTNLTDSNLTGAHISSANFGATILTNALGLDSCKHGSPSYIDHLTLMNNPNLPQSFLRGCGLADSLIDYLPSLTNQPIQYYSCFISYNKENKSFAQRLHDQLQGRGIRCWLDDHQILPGDNIYDKIHEGIIIWDKVLLCCSKDSLNSPWVHREIEKALKKEEELWKARNKKTEVLIPLNLDGYLFGWSDGKASELTNRQAPNFTGWEQDNSIYETQLEKVILALRADDAAREKPPTPKL